MHFITFIDKIFALFFEEQDDLFDIEESNSL